MTYTLPVCSAGGSDVRIFDVSAEQLLNTHYQQPSELNAVESMSCGKADEGVVAALMTKIPQYGIKPFLGVKRGRGFDDEEHP